MDKQIIILIVVVISILVLLTLSQGAYYGVAGTPKIVLLSPVCNSTVRQDVVFTWHPEPNTYYSYKVQIKSGENWDVENLLYATVFDTTYSATLEPGVYMYNVVAYDSSNQAQAGSNPCRFVVG